MSEFRLNRSATHHSRLNFAVLATVQGQGLEDYETEQIWLQHSYDGDVSNSRFFNAVLKVLGPVLLGFGTIFQPKAIATDHWSTSPQITIQVEVSADESGNPPRQDEDLGLVYSTTT